MAIFSARRRRSSSSGQATPSALQHLGRRLGLHGHLGVDGGVVERRLVAAPCCDQGGVEVVAQVLQHARPAPTSWARICGAESPWSRSQPAVATKAATRAGGQPGGRVVAQRLALGRRRAGRADALSTAGGWSMKIRRAPSARCRRS